MSSQPLGIGLPTMIPGVDPDLVFRWAERAEGGPFSMLATGELLTSEAYDPLIALTAAAAVTRRVELLSNVVVLPLHPAGLLAEQAASLDQLSRGRLLLGIGVGARKPVLKSPSAESPPDADLPDYRVAPAPVAGRYERFEEQIAHMGGVWSGQALTEDGLRVGPPPSRSGGPPLIVGGFAAGFLQRSARWADGLTTFGLVPDVDRMVRDFGVMRRAWEGLGRKGPKRLIASHFFALGPEAEQGTRNYVARHYGHLGREDNRRLAAAISTTHEAALRDVFRALVDAGATDVIPIPMIPSLDQVDRLAEVLGG